MRDQTPPESEAILRDITADARIAIGCRTIMHRQGGVVLSMARRAITVRPDGDGTYCVILTPLTRSGTRRQWDAVPAADLPTTVIRAGSMR